MSYLKKRKDERPQFTTKRNVPKGPLGRKHLNRRGVNECKIFYVKQMRFTLSWVLSKLDRDLTTSERVQACKAIITEINDLFGSDAVHITKRIKLEKIHV